MPTTPTDAERRHHAAVVRAARMGGSLAVRVRTALASCLDALPENPSPHDLHAVRARVELVTTHLAAVLADRLRRMLLAAAEREHWLTAVALTRAANRGRVEEGWRDYFKLLVPAPAREFLERIVGPLWRRVVGVIAPERAGNAVLQGIAQGKNRRQIAADLTEVFDGYEAGARRVARTAGLQAATQTQLAVSEEVPDLVIGYELNTVLDDRVRPEHRAAHGHRFYRTPVGDRRPLSDCPQPPIWNGKVAWNCRCFLVPIISIDGEEV